MGKAWAGVDIGKEHHHCVVLDAYGKRLLSRRVLKDQAELASLIDDVSAMAADVPWAVDSSHGGAALLIGLLVARGQPITYLNGLAVHRAAGSYRGESKTDVKEAFVIADQARLRRDLGRCGPPPALDIRIGSVLRVPTAPDRTRGCLGLARGQPQHSP